MHGLASAMLAAIAWTGSPETGAFRGRGYELRWQAPPPCPDGRDVVAAIDRALVAPRGQATTARVTIEPVASGFRMRLGVGEGESAERVLESESCTDLANAAALIVAIAVDPGALEREPPAVQIVDGGVVPAPPPPPRPVPVPARRPVPERPVAAAASIARPRPIDRHAWTFAGRLSAGVGAALVPRATMVLEGTWAALTGRFRAEVGAAWWMLRAVSADARVDVGARYQIAAALGRLCFAPGDRRFRVPLCGGIEIGAYTARGVGDLEPTLAAFFWSAVRFGPAARVLLAPTLALWVQLELVVPLVRPRFGTEPSGELFRVPAVGGVVVAGLEFGRRLGSGGVTASRPSRGPRR